MAKYKFDGTYLKDGSTVLANVKGNEIREGRGTAVMGNIKGDDIRQGNGTSKIATMKDVDKEIDGPGRVIKAALWLLCCR
ncbi:MAG: hypothetical protein ACLQUW_02550 [Desulfobaccales bacterium]